MTTTSCASCGGPIPSADPEGCWVVYGEDYGPYFISVHLGEIEALRTLNGEVGHRVVFVRWGQNLTSAVTEQERH